MRNFGFWMVWAMVSALAFGGCGEKEFKTLTEVHQEQEASKHYSKGKLERLAKNASEKRYDYMKKFREAEAKVRAIPLEKQFDKPAIKLKEEMRVHADKVRDYGMLYDSYMHYYLEKGGDYEKIKLRKEYE